MNINVMGCVNVVETKIIKEIQLGATKIKFCDEYIAKTKEDREQRIREFKQASLNLIQETTEGGVKDAR